MFLSHARGPRSARRHAHRGPRGMHGKRRGGPRRPLRILIERLGLDDAQTAEVARILGDLRLEREQADLDRRRGSSALADLIAADVLDTTALASAAEVRVTAAARQRDAVVSTVERLHALLSPEQRTKLSTLMRSGPLSL